MKFKSIQLLFSAAVCCSLIIACSSSDGGGSSSDDVCTAMQSLHIQPVAAVTKGQAITLVADDNPDVNYYWTGPNNWEAYDSSTVTVTSSSDFNQEGWYYVTISHEGCEDRIDSVYVDVKFPQGTPSCSLTNNTATFSGSVILANQAFYYLNFGSDPVTDGYQVTANSSNGDMTMYMSAYWLTHDFEDGIYYSTNDQFLDYNEIDKVFISNVNGSILWTCENNKPVYISHVNGKVRISFCGINFSGSNGGPSYTTTISSQVTQP